MTHSARLFKSVLTVLTGLSATFVVGLTSTSHAHSGHTPNVCARTATTVCAHLGFDAEPNSSDSWSFMLHFMPASGVDPKLITNVSVKLWMDMGSHSHGSSPVTLAGVDDVHYQITDAYFPMAGPWQVKVGFTFENINHEIIIPVMVKN
jgi:hypothetical protein